MTLPRLLFVLLGSWIAVAPGTMATGQISFSKEIAPILINKCSVCHNPEKSKGGFQIQTFTALMKPGESKLPPITAGQPNKSHLFELITTADPDDRMPQKDEPLPKEQIELIRRWIEEGASFDGADRNLELIRIAPRARHPVAPVAYSRPIPIVALAWIAGGAELAVNGFNEITIWNPASGQLARRISNVAQKTQSLAFDPISSILAGASGIPGRLGEVSLFDLGTNESRVVGIFGDMALCAAFSPDGKLLAAGVTDNSIHVYEMASGKERLVIQQHADWVTALSFSPDGKRLASASRDRSARVYDTSNGNLETTFTEHEGPVYAVVFAADGKLVYSAGKDKKILAWNSQDGKKSGEISGFNGELLQLAIAGDHLFSCGTDKTVREHSTADKKLIRAYEGNQDWVYCIAVNPETHRLASGSYDGEVRMWNTQNGDLIQSFRAVP